MDVILITEFYMCKNTKYTRYFNWFKIIKKSFF